MNRRVKSAILKVGGIASALDGGGDFSANIQPKCREDDGHTEIGTGFISRFTMYTSCDGTAGALREGSRIEFHGNRYIVNRIETYYFRGDPVYRRGTIILEQEGGYGEPDGA